jgi:hypothetical protein
MRVFARTHLGGKVFGLGDGTFVFAVRLTHQMVMTATGKVAFRRVTAPGVNHFAASLHQAKSGSAADAYALRGRNRLHRVARHFDSLYYFVDRSIIPMALGAVIVIVNNLGAPIVLRTPQSAALGSSSLGSFIVALRRWTNR